MGQKINPHGLRVGVIKGWDSRWFAKDGNVGDLLVEDYKIREFLKKKLYQAGVPTIEIERKGDKVHIFIHCARPTRTPSSSRRTSRSSSRSASASAAR